MKMLPVLVTRSKDSIPAEATKAIQMPFNSPVVIRSLQKKKGKT
jgi:hypothetical protein